MKKWKKVVSALLIGIMALGSVIYAVYKSFIKDSSKASDDAEQRAKKHKKGFYEKYLKRPQDFCCSN